MRQLRAVCFLGILLTFGVPAKAELIYALTNANSLFSFDSATPSTGTPTVAITGLQPGDSLIAIDVRPLNGKLYGLGNLSNLYIINPVSGVATQVGSHGGFSLSGTSFGFDFNPVVDLIRVVSNTGQNVRLNPDTGVLVATDLNVAYAAGDPNFGATPNIEGAAYSNNFVGAGSTTLYDIDATLRILATQDPANAGALHTVGSLGIAFTLQNNLGFDISGASGVAYAAFNATGSPTTQLSIVSLMDGDSGGVANIGSDVIDIAVAGVSVISRKAHGAVGTFSIPMPLVGPSGVEDRVGNAGVAGNHTIVFSYTNSPADVLASVAAHDPPGATGTISNVQVSGNDLIVNLTNVSNPQVLTLSTSGGTLSPVTVPIGFLLGDTNGSRSVSAADVGQTKAQSGNAAGAANFRTDTNVSGAISAADIGQVKASSGTSIP